MNSNNRKFTCASCEKTFTAAWTEEEALAEKTSLWGDLPMENTEVVCDDCFHILMKEVKRREGSA